MPDSKVAATGTDKGRSLGYSDRLVGFTDQEIEIVAQIARYHRKSAPKASHVEWAALDDDDQRTVVVSAAVLRIAIGLDRSHQQLVTGVHVHERDGTLVVSMITEAADADLSLELYAAGERSGLLASVLDLPVRIVVTDAVATADA